MPSRACRSPTRSRTWVAVGLFGALAGLAAAVSACGKADHPKATPAAPAAGPSDGAAPATCDAGTLFWCVEAADGQHQLKSRKTATEPCPLDAADKVTDGLACFELPNAGAFRRLVLLKGEKGAGEALGSPTVTLGATVSFHIAAYSLANQYLSDVAEVTVTAVTAGAATTPVAKVAVDPVTGVGVITPSAPGTEALLVLYSGADKESTYAPASLTVTVPPTPIAGAPAVIRPIAFAGVATHGIFDASVTRDPASGRLWMSYSATTSSALWPTGNPVVVATRLAVSDDAGTSWKDSGALINAATDVTLPRAAPANAGSWKHETSSLVYDPGAPIGERWKLFWYHLLQINAVNQPADGWIAYKTADTPEHLASAPEVKLFSSAYYDHENDNAAGSTRSPLAGVPKIALDTAFGAALNGCVAVEPGLYATATALYAAFGCVQVAASQATSHKVFVMKCASPCNAPVAASWRLLGVALDQSDAIGLGFKSGFNAPALFEASGSVYLAATPVTDTPFKDHYDGCLIYKFADLETATLARTNGKLTAGRAVAGAAGSFNGMCAYVSQATGAGVLYGQLFPDEGEPFRLFSSGINL